MKAASFNRLIAEAYTTPLKTVTVYTRLLKEAGLLTTGARGRNAPHMTPMDAARTTLAILSTDSPSQCVERVKRFGQMKYAPHFKKNVRGYETMQPDQFKEVLRGETLEEVLAYIFSLPSVLGVSESIRWLERYPFGLSVFDFEVLAELSIWRFEGREKVGELVVPFKGDVMVKTANGFEPVAGYQPIKGGVRTRRSIAGINFSAVALGLLHDEESGIASDHKSGRV